MQLAMCHLSAFVCIASALIFKVHLPQQGDTFLLVMEYVSGGSLFQALQDEGSMFMWTVSSGPQGSSRAGLGRYVAIQIADALMYLHSNHVSIPTNLWTDNWYPLGMSLHVFQQPILSNALRLFGGDRHVAPATPLPAHGSAPE